MRLRVVSSVLLAFGALLSSCTEPSVEVGFDDLATRGGSAGMGAGGVGANGGTGGATTCVKATCQGKGPYLCGDCEDNDHDGLIDALDPDCLGACDNTEDSYYGGIPGQNGGSCRKDCYFDQDSGSGNDRCEWSQSCDALSPSSACPYDPNEASAGASCDVLRQTQATTCLDVCLPITPNGCDCFGCCELPARSNRFVWLGSELNGVGTCDRAHVNDPSACAPCTPVPSCLNRCEPCEICAGEKELDASCTAGTQSCSVGTPCGPGATCPGTTYCVTGCCIEVPR